MTNEEFNYLVEDAIEDIRQTLSKKGEEYAYGDRLSNFKQAAEFLGCTPEQALWGFVTKHIVALGDFIREFPDKPISKKQWLEKTGDIRCYTILLEGLLWERGVFDNA